MLLLMLVTRLASPGPVFYRQRRVGLGGRQFMIWKFRTMKVSAETQTHERYYEELIRTNCAMTKLDANGDPRLAPFGRILRASGLDELPQIFNVLAGEMSLVGPRPCIPNEFANYEPWQRERVNGLPGLTGLWQVSGKNKTTFNEMIRMDLAYLHNMSLLLDLKIIFKTAATIARQVIECRQTSHAAPAEPKSLTMRRRFDPSTRSRTENMKKQITVGVLGCGYWGPLLIRNFRSLPECRLKVVCDLDIARRKTRLCVVFGCRRS